MISINTNYGSMHAAKSAGRSQQAMDTAMERLSSGLRINKAKDDAAGQAISTRLSAEVQGLQMASRNAADAQSMIDTAEGALQETHNVLLRMRELAVQSANGTLTDGDRAHTDAEFDQLVAEVTRIAENTTWAGKSLLDGSVDGAAAAGGNPARPALSFQIGEGANQTISVEIDNMSAGSLGTATGTSGVALNAAGLDSTTNAQTAIISIDNAIDSVSKARGEMGAVSNRLSSTMSNLDQIAVNLSASQGRIQDADFAQETGNLAKNQILQQAATAMIAQANASKSSVLTLVRG